MQIAPNDGWLAGLVRVFTTLGVVRDKNAEVLPPIGPDMPIINMRALFPDVAVKVPAEAALPAAAVDETVDA